VSGTDFSYIFPMKVNEIFYSIQGESSFMGRPSAFVRLTGCDLRCSFCDTEYAFYEGTEMSADDILAAIEAYPARLVLVTGGEPMLQPGIHALLGALLNRNWTVCLETGGHQSLAGVDPRVHKIMDFKCPSSRMSDRNNYENVACLTRRDEVKFVIGNREDFDWAVELVRRLGLESCIENILFSPVFGQLPYQDLARWLLDSGLKARMQLQLHKIIWPDVQRGV
jgi:7-carboxy-7-deazaguanine synthase